MWESAVVVYMEFGQQVVPQQVGGVALVEKKVELHPSWRRWAVGLSEIGAEGQKVQKSKLVTFFLL